MAGASLALARHAGQRTGVRGSARRVAVRAQRVPAAVPACTRWAGAGARRASIDDGRVARALPASRSTARRVTRGRPANQCTVGGYENRHSYPTPSASR